MAAVLYRMSSWARARWRAVCALWLIIAIGGGGVLLLVAGATRTVSAPDRYSDWRGHTFDVTIQQFAGLPRTDELRSLPATGRVDAATFVFGELGARRRGARSDALVFAGTQGPLGTRLVAGHLPEDAHPLEFVGTRTFVRQAKAKVGDRFDVGFFTQSQADEQGFSTSPPPSDVATLVGVIDGPGDLEDGYAVALFPTSLLDRGNIGVSATVVAAALAPGSSRADLRRQLDALPHGGTFTLDTAEWVSKDVRSAVNAQGEGLLVLSGIVLVAAIVVLGQLLSRQLRLDDGEQSVLEAMGWTRRQLFAEALCRVAATVVVGVLGALGVAYLASDAFPLGFVGRVEPHPGRRFDPVVHGLGPALFALALLLWVVGTLLLDARPRARERRSVTVADRLAAAVPSAQVGTALRFAFAPPGRRARSVGAPLLGLILVCSIFVGAVTFGSGLVTLVDRPAAYGVNFDAAFGEGSTDTQLDLQRILRQSRDISAFTLYGTTTASAATTSLNVVGLQKVRGDIAPEVEAGRLPTGADEVALARLVARRLHLGLGDRLVVKGSSGRRSLTITGIVLVPPVGGTDGLANGAVVSLAGFRSLDPSAGMNTAVIRYRRTPGAVARVAALTGARVGSVDPPAAIVNLRRVRGIPFLVAGVVGGFAVLSLGHLMVVAVRRRRRDLAILRSLGATRRWLSGVVHWQASAITGLVLAVAIPIGSAAGRSVYRAFVDHVGVRSDATVPFGWLAVALVSLLVGANLIAAVPARRGARASAAAVLSEG